MQEITQGHCRYITQSKADLQTNNYAKKKKKKKKKTQWPLHKLQEATSGTRA